MVTGKFGYGGGGGSGGGAPSYSRTGSGGGGTRPPSPPHSRSGSSSSGGSRSHVASSPPSSPSLGSSSASTLSSVSLSSLAGVPMTILLADSEVPTLDRIGEVLGRTAGRSSHAPAPPPLPVFCSLCDFPVHFYGKLVHSLIPRHSHSADATCPQIFSLS